MKRILFYSSIFILAGCFNPPIKVESCNVCVEDYQDKKVEMEGTLYLPSRIITSGVMHMAIKCNGANKTPIVGFKPGRDKNQMETLPNDYTENDVKIHDNNGNLIKVGDNVKIIGEMVATSKAWCQIKVIQIEKL